MHITFLVNHVKLIVRVKGHFVPRGKERNNLLSSLHKFYDMHS